MCLIYGYQRHRQAAKPDAEVLALQPLGRYVEETVRAILAVVQYRLYLRVRHARIDTGGTDVAPAEVLHLVFHQGDQRRHHQTQSFGDKGWYLKTETLTAARRHEGEGVLSPQYPLDDLGLYAAKVVVAVVAL